MNSFQNNGHCLHTIDFDLHDLAGIRILNATLADVAAVTRQLGPIQAPLTREPDIIIRFVDRLPVSSPVSHIGVDDAGFTDDAFLVLRGKYKADVRVQIPFDQIGKQCEIVCERGLPAVPLLIPILNLTLLNKGVLPLHAAAFKYNGTGVVTTGWSKGGKTETLLAFMARGAEYIGDEWVFISGDGRRIYGIPEPIRLWDWHLDDLPQYRARVARTDLARLRAIRLIRSVARVLRSDARNGFAPARVLNRVMPVLKRQLYVDMPPTRLFAGGIGKLSGPFDRLLFVVSHESPDVLVQSVDPQEVAQRMVFSLQHERLDFMSYYEKFRFAFPEARNELIEEAEALQRELLTRVFADKVAYTVYHPYPVAIPALFDAISPFVTDCSSQKVGAERVCPRQSRGHTPFPPGFVTVIVDDNRAAVEPGSQISADALLQASRRVDWRFLLPDPDLGRVAYIGPAKGSLLESLRLLSASLTVMEPNSQSSDGANPGRHDVVVAVAPTTAALRRAIALLKPGGSLYLEAHSPLLRRGLARRLEWPRFAHDYAASLQGLGMDEIETYWHWPDFERCTKILPLDAPAALLHVFAPQRSSAKVRLKSVLGRWLLRSDALTLVVPCFSIVARSPIPNLQSPKGVE